MNRRYLFEPVNGYFADQYLHRQRQAGQCVTFNAAGDADFLIKGSRKGQGGQGGRGDKGGRKGTFRVYLREAERGHG